METRLILWPLHESTVPDEVSSSTSLIVGVCQLTSSLPLAEQPRQRRQTTRKIPSAFQLKSNSVRVDMCENTGPDF